MKTAHPAVRLSLVLLFVLSGLAAPRGAWAQFAAGVYRGVENGTGNMFLLRLELSAALPNSSSLVVGTVFNLETGTYRVAAGRADRGGLNIYFSNSALPGARPRPPRSSPPPIRIRRRSVGHPDREYRVDQYLQLLPSGARRRHGSRLHLRAGRRSPSASAVERYRPAVPTASR